MKYYTIPCVLHIEAKSEDDALYKAEQVLGAEVPNVSLIEEFDSVEQYWAIKKLNRKIGERRK